MLIVMLLMSGLAAAFVIWPLFMRAAKAAGNEHDAAVMGLYRQRLGELDVEWQRYADDPGLRLQVRDELSMVLLTDMPTDADPEVEQPDRQAVAGDILAARSALPWWQNSLLRRFTIMALALPVFAVGLYLWIADTGVTDLRGAEQVMSMQVGQQRAEIEDWRDRLQARVAAQADDHKSWYLLGHAQLKLGNFDGAAQAFASTSALVEDVNVQVYWLQARYLASGGNFDQFSRELAERLLQQNPNLVVVLEMLATDALHHGRLAETITLLNRAISGSADVNQQASFAAAIRQVRTTLNAAPDQQETSAAAGVTVQASAVAPVPDNATLFILARPVGGGMPYAVVKRPAGLLPVTVQLDDLVSMSPTRLLSSAQTFEVVARISKSGTAMAAADDWQWVSPVQDNSSPMAGPRLLQAELAPPAAD